MDRHNIKSDDIIKLIRHYAPAGHGWRREVYLNNGTLEITSLLCEGMNEYHKGTYICSIYDEIKDNIDAYNLQKDIDRRNEFLDELDKRENK